jgi:hypothetical protein
LGWEVFKFMGLKNFKDFKKSPLTHSSPSHHPITRTRQRERRWGKQ